MAMTVHINLCTGAAAVGEPTTRTAVESPSAGFTFNREDTQAGTTPIPTPTSAPATKFSYVKTLQLSIANAGGLTMTNVQMGRVNAESTTGHQCWRYWGHSSYTQAVAAPADTIDNNVTGPTINGATGVVLELISAPPTAYAPGPYAGIDDYGNFVELVWGIDSQNVTTGTLSMTGGLRWQWIEA